MSGIVLLFKKVKCNSKVKLIFSLFEDRTAQEQAVSHQNQKKGESSWLQPEMLRHYLLTLSRLDTSSLIEDRQQLHFAGLAGHLFYTLMRCCCDQKYPQT